MNGSKTKRQQIETDSVSAWGRLKLYRQLSRLGRPRSYAGKLVLIASLAIDVPLLALVFYLALAPHRPPAWAMIGVGLLAALLATLVLRWIMPSLLAPAELTRRAFARYLAGDETHELPAIFTDELGILMRDAGYAIDRFHASRLRLEEFAAFDALTGLLNRRAASDRLEQGFNLARRAGGPLCIAMLDIDRFKLVNDRYGHAAGDRVLAAVATQIRTSLRGADWAARWGGEEFLVLLNADLTGSHSALERLRHAVEELSVLHDERTIRCTISAGCAEIHPGDTVEQTVARADAALYDAKHAGRNQVCLEPAPMPETP
ncbi:MAG: GGDEF domain-containing protein [Dehalococcoidia bacterium]